jgi:CRP/FNR family cyclic AMP-dependent transcriptional regulator
VSDLTKTRMFRSAGYFEPKPVAGHKPNRPPAIFLAETPVEVASKTNFLSRLSADDYRRVREIGHEQTVDAGESVFCQGDVHDGIFLIERGSVRTFYTGPTGREITLAYWTPGHFVGGPEIFGGGQHMWSGVATEDSRLLWLRGGDLYRLMEKMPGLALGIVEGLVQKGKCYSALVHMLGTRSVVERLAQLLLILADTDGVATEKGIEIQRGFTHEELANMVGSTRQWVTVTLDKFQKQGAVRIRGRRIYVADRAWMCDKAGLVPDEMETGPAFSAGPVPVR